MSHVGLGSKINPRNSIGTKKQIRDCRGVGEGDREEFLLKGVRSPFGVMKMPRN